MRKLLGFLLVAACSMGPRVNRFAPVRDPQGALARVTRGRVAFNAELLAITDSALLVLDTDATRVTLVPYRAATGVTFPELPADYWLRRGGAPSSHVREQLRLWSRFPAGVDAEMQRRLLAAYHQDSLIILSPCAPRAC